MKIYPIEFLERCLKLTVSLLKIRLEREMRTASRRERRFDQKWAHRAGESAVARPWRACWVRAAHKKHMFFIGERKNVHRTQARAHSSKCTPRTGESSILPTQDGVKRSTSLRRKHHSQQKCAPQAGESAAARPRHAGRGRHRHESLDFSTRDVHEMHRASTGEP